MYYKEIKDDLKLIDSKKQLSEQEFRSLLLRALHVIASAADVIAFNISKK
jgi:hypothetical protein